MLFCGQKKPAQFIARELEPSLILDVNPWRSVGYIPLVRLQARSPTALAVVFRHARDPAIGEGADVTETEGVFNLHRHLLDRAFFHCF